MSHTYTDNPQFDELNTFISLYKAIVEWLKDFEKKMREIENNPEDWMGEHINHIKKLYGENPCYEDIVQYFIKVAILGDSYE